MYCSRSNSFRLAIATLSLFHFCQTKSSIIDGVWLINCDYPSVWQPKRVAKYYFDYMSRRVPFAVIRPKSELCPEQETSTYTCCSAIYPFVHEILEAFTYFEVSTNYH